MLADEFAAGAIGGDIFRAVVQQSTTPQMASGVVVRGFLCDGVVMVHGGFVWNLWFTIYKMLFKNKKL